MFGCAASGTRGDSCGAKTAASRLEGNGCFAARGKRRLCGSQEVAASRLGENGCLAVRRKRPGFAARGKRLSAQERCVHGSQETWLLRRSQENGSFAAAGGRCLLRGSKETAAPSGRGKAAALPRSQEMPALAGRGKTPASRPGRQKNDSTARNKNSGTCKEIFIAR